MSADQLKEFLQHGVQTGGYGSGSGSGSGIGSGSSSGYVRVVVVRLQERPHAGCIYIQE